ncbi:MAG: hypothetical protein WCG27_02045, partial [Pseudomonadota bacterium]
MKKTLSFFLFILMLTFSLGPLQAATPSLGDKTLAYLDSVPQFQLIRQVGKAMGVDIWLAPRLATALVVELNHYLATGENLPFARQRFNFTPETATLVNSQQPLQLVLSVPTEKAVTVIAALQEKLGVRPDVTLFRGHFDSNNPLLLSSPTINNWPMSASRGFLIEITNIQEGPGRFLDLQDPQHQTGAEQLLNQLGQKRLALMFPANLENLPLEAEILGALDYLAEIAELGLNIP